MQIAVVLTMSVCVVSKGVVEERKLAQQKGWSEGGNSRNKVSGSSQHSQHGHRLGIHLG